MPSNKTLSGEDANCYSKPLRRLEAVTSHGKVKTTQVEQVQLGLFLYMGYKKEIFHFRWTEPNCRDTNTG